MVLWANKINQKLPSVLFTLMRYKNKNTVQIK